MTSARLELVFIRGDGSKVEASADVTIDLARLSDEDACQWLAMASQELHEKLFEKMTAAPPSMADAKEKARIVEDRERTLREYSTHRAVAADAWEETIRAYLSTRVWARHGPVTSDEIAFDALKLRKSQVDRKAQTRIASLLRGLGYCQAVRRMEGVSRKCYVPSQSPPESPPPAQREPEEGHSPMGVGEDHWACRFCSRTRPNTERPTKDGACQTCVREMAGLWVCARCPRWTNVMCDGVVMCSACLARRLADEKGLNRKDYPYPPVEEIDMFDIKNARRWSELLGVDIAEAPQPCHVQMGYEAPPRTHGGGGG